MDAELSALAAAGATALVQQMVTDRWPQVRDRAVAFFSRRRGGDQAVIEGELEASRARLVAARGAEDQDAEAAVQAEWRNRLRRTLRSDPAAAAQLRALLDELGPVPSAQRQVAVHNTIKGGAQHRTAIQAGSVGNLTIGTPRPPTTR
ncbi:hypothetical protein [Streptomyces himalayensis]|uniref:Uncharacterized protein n=1 Tax=Streptomyces himalayensis subsp. himalayensis TaxID=2756131 RepID=A0A7W0IAK8_9ACTN|nr:hypothetical protein [Streptomyces himalayensis]MBA2948261.1 hypothetical protein [Streptomyces himalayensis subsp. himalayensis]